MRHNGKTRLLGAFLFCTLVALPGGAQPRPDSLTILVSPGLVNFALKPSGISTGSFPIVLTTTWQIQRGGTNVRVYAYFSVPNAALSNAAGGAIPTSRVFGSVNAGPFQPFTGTSPLAAGGSLLILSQQVRNNKQFTRSDSLEIQIDTTGLGLTPGAYTGVMRIQALAI
jgi:hypothetical protein